MLQEEVLEEHVEQLLLSTVLCPALQSLTQTFFWWKIEGTREIRGWYSLILVQIIFECIGIQQL